MNHTFQDYLSELTEPRSGTHVVAERALDSIRRSHTLSTGGTEALGPHVVRLNDGPEEPKI